MSRSRNIKPGFFKNYDLADLGPHCQLLFAGLWCLADREGRLEDKPRFIKAELFPYYDMDVNGGLTLLHESGFVKRYTVNGKPLIQVVFFKKHQSPHSTEKASTMPGIEHADLANPCPEKVTVNPPLDNVDSRKDFGGNPPDSLIPDSLIAEVKALSTSEPSAPKIDGDDVTKIFDYWREVFASPKSVLDEKRRNVIRKALKAGHTPRDLCRAIQGCSRTPHNLGENDRGQKFIGIQVILRDADQIDRFIANSVSPPKLTEKKVSGGAWWLSDASALVQANAVGVGPAHYGESTPSWHARIRAAIDNGGKPVGVPTPAAVVPTPVERRVEATPEQKAARSAALHAALHGTAGQPA